MKTAGKTRQGNQTLATRHGADPGIGLVIAIHARIQKVDLFTWYPG